MITSSSFEYIAPSERLREIAETLEAGKHAQPITVREFLGWFGAYKRGFWIVKRIREALTTAGLITKPDFHGVYIDAAIEFRLASESVSAAPKLTLVGADAELTAPAADADSLVIAGITDPTYRIGKLSASNRVPVSVKPDEELRTAVTLMLAHDYSQLPVMTSEREVKGVVSWRSIGSRWALEKDGELVRHFLDDAPDIDADRSLFSALPVIIDRGFIIVRDATRKVVGIVTASDLGEQFQQLAEPFLLVGEIENHTRRLIDGKFTKEELASVKEPNDPRPIETVADLTFGQYVRLLQEPSKWSKVAPHIDRVTFTKQLDEVREIRNEIMHFDPDPMEEASLQTLRRFSRFLQTLHTLGL